MAKRILVPLDQSLLAESILPIVTDVARGAGATVCLLHVEPVPPSRVDEDGRVLAYADQEMARLEHERWTTCGRSSCNVRRSPWSAGSGSAIR